ncbi:MULTISPECIES: GtrA family protein [unclassified Streptomyces]|uniref:GtrA family protein n=1 Tax=unclassified Streptomyces TaxID=2593676 RepID=UPI0013AE0EA1|nr:GtrA family protein [Streptomyces sp. SID8499]MYS40348.1 GtrA family protein [Streptomyces sp. SID5998]NED36993.1 GtrA family protein [Streptomyces sp. SID8499]
MGHGSSGRRPAPPASPAPPSAPAEAAAAESGGGLLRRAGRVWREIVKFGAVGGAGLLVNLLVFNLVRHVTDLPVVRASIIATVVSIVFNYIGFRYFTYRDRDKSGRTKELTLFLLFSAVGLVIENGVLYLATYGFGWDTPLQSNVFKFLGIGIATLFRFWSYRTWVFRALPVAKESGAPGGDRASGSREAAADAESYLRAQPKRPEAKKQRSKAYR